MPKGFTPIADSNTAPKGFTPIDPSPANASGALTGSTQGIRGAGQRSFADMFPGAQRVEQFMTTPMLQTPSDPSMAEEARDRAIAQGSPARAAVNAFLGGAGRDASNMISSAASPLGAIIAALTGGEGTVGKVGLAAIEPYLGMKAYEGAITPRQPGEAPVDELSRRMQSAAGIGAMVPGTAAGLRNIGQDVRTVAQIKNSLTDASHDMLYKSMRESQRKTADAQQAISANVGNLKKGLGMAADAAGVKAPMADILDTSRKTLDKLISNFKGSLDRPLPWADKAISLLSAQNPELSMSELLDLRTDLGKMWNRAGDPQDAAAVSTLRDKLTSKARDLSEQISQKKQFESYNKVWNVLQQYEDKGILGKLQNTQVGQDYFTLLNDKKNGPQLRQLAQDLNEQAGKLPNGKEVFPENHFSQLARNHQDIYEFVTRPTGLRGVLRNIKDRPMAGVGGAIAGYGLGAATGVHPFLSGLLGSTAGVAMADRLAAIRNISKLGGVSEIQGLMGPRVEPDFGGGLSGRVIEELQKGPGGGGQGPFIPGGGRRYRPEDPQTQSFIEQQINRPIRSADDFLSLSKEDQAKALSQLGTKNDPTTRKYNPSIADKAKEVERIRAEKGKPVGEATRQANRKLGTSESTTSKDVQAQQDQAELLRKYLAGDPADVSRKVEELRQAIEKRKGK